MRSLIQNYSSEISTEPVQFNQALLELGVEATMWDAKLSAFDVFDRANPDIFITHYSLVSKDLVKRLKDTEVKVALNCTGINSENLDILNGCGLKVDLAYTNFPNDLNLTVIQPCCDIFLARRKVDAPKYDIDNLIIINDQSDLHLLDNPPTGTFHVLTTRQDLNALKEVDAYLPIHSMYSVFSNYKHIVCGNYFQSAFDAAYYGGKCDIVDSNSTLEPLRGTGEKTLKSLVKLSVETVATPYNRISELLGRIGEDNLAGKADEKGHSYFKRL